MLDPGVFEIGGGREVPTVVVIWLMPVLRADGDIVLVVLFLHQRLDLGGNCLTAIDAHSAAFNEIILYVHYDECSLAHDQFSFRSSTASV